MTISHTIFPALLLLISTGLSGCNFLTKPPFVGFELPESAGPEIYRLGYKHGCQSGYGGYSTAFYKPFNKWIQDPNLTGDKMYYQIWKDAYSFCSMYALMHGTHGWGNAQ